MAWTFDVFASIPACFLLSILTLVPQGFASSTPCETCTSTALGGKGGYWCLKTYLTSPVTQANYCVPKVLPNEACLGGHLSTRCPRPPTDLTIDYSEKKAEPLTCTACVAETGKWCVRGVTNPSTTPPTFQHRFCVPAAKVRDCETVVGAAGAVVGVAGAETACGTSATDSATDNVGESATETKCAQCIDGGKTWCFKDYGAGKANGAYCAVSATPGICIGGEPITDKDDCPTHGKDRRLEAADIPDCNTCMVTLKQKWCLKGKPGNQFRACVPKEAVPFICPTAAESRTAVTCNELVGVETKATTPTDPTTTTTEKPKTTEKKKEPETEKPAETTTKKGAASTVGVLTASVLAAMLVAAT